MPSADKMKALIVDDQSSIRLLIRQGLMQIGFREIHEAADGEDGLRQIVARPDSLIISDYNMPKVDGLTFLRAVRMHAATRAAPFIMLTGRADRELVARAVEFGVNNYLVKPFTVASLREKVEAVIGQLK